MKLLQSFQRWREAWSTMLILSLCCSWQNLHLILAFRILLRKHSMHLVFSSPVKSSFFYLKTRQLATATGLDRSRYSGTATGPLKTGPNRSTTRKKPVQTSCNRFFVVKFIVPNKSNITSCKLHKWIDISILCRLVKVSSNFVKVWLRYGENGRDIHSSCI